MTAQESDRTKIPLCGPYSRTLSVPCSNVAPSVSDIAEVQIAVFNGAERGKDTAEIIHPNHTVGRFRIRVLLSLHISTLYAILSLLVDPEIHPSEPRTKQEQSRQYSTNGQWLL